MSEPMASMPPPTPPPPKRRNRLRRFARRLLYVLLALIVIHLVATIVTGHMVKKELNRLRAKGEKLQLSELVPTVPPGAPNAADVYQEAFTSWQVTKEEQKVIDESYEYATDLTVKVPDTTLALAQQALEKNTRYFTLLDQASRIEACAFPVDWKLSNPAALTFPHLAKLREATRRLSLRARFFADTQKPDEALRTDQIILRIAQHAGSEPTIISLLVRQALYGMVVKSIHSVLAVSDPSPVALIQLQVQLQSAAATNSFRRGFQGERCFTIAIFDINRRDVMSIGRLLELRGYQNALFILYSTLGRPLLNLDELTYLKASADYLAVVDKSYVQAKSVIDKINATPRYRSWLMHMLAPIFIRTFISRTTRNAQLIMAWYATHLKLYRYQHHGYPASLSSLPTVTGTPPLDPFSQQLYHYRQSGKGYILWSVGVNGIDDNGSEANDPVKHFDTSYPLDVVFSSAQ